MFFGSHKRLFLVLSIILTFTLLFSFVVISLQNSKFVPSTVDGRNSRTPSPVSTASTGPMEIPDKRISDEVTSAANQRNDSLQDTELRHYECTVTYTILGRDLNILDVILVTDSRVTSAWLKVSWGESTQTGPVTIHEGQGKQRISFSSRTLGLKPKVLVYSTSNLVENYLVCRAN